MIVLKTTPPFFALLVSISLFHHAPALYIFVSTSLSKTVIYCTPPIGLMHERCMEVTQAIISTMCR